MKTAKKIRGILLWMLITALSACILYVSVGSPPFSPEMAMHRREKAQLVGPSQVIGKVEAVSKTREYLLVGETEYGYCFYMFDDKFHLWDAGGLTYVEKGTRECFLTENLYYPNQQDAFPVFAVTQNPKAVSARLTLVTHSDLDPIYTETHTALAELSCGVFYQFAVDMSDMDSDVLHFWAYRFRKDTDSVLRFISGTATLELFDREGNLLETIVTEYPATK